ncbi:MAG: aminotransferase class I/II-fold pyridoxal phosphate-dependent enzyme [Candidatus Marinimicrobia bacterium]|nr:aminotransferase class I/II-fold pyridoxal phosphate-dependent enzyme [Candidatus Neomarinimicrobiota bacterium]MCF7827449.1 aminotransferase class I/II-fold pyridoxal phosphate-dependent enzyme [Candidatus Neomarinimicrobiota bacterium]MCF7882324.1 aminotransferase class I/II-fold pyridoxal phosphate-dependent enzyme [Candidatus Neomarinimicrobiota bacterium]
MEFAQRMARIGTETAFAVGAQAGEWAAKGNKVYPFHLGDMNIITPKNIREAATRAMNDGKTGYCPNAGIPELRKALANDVGSQRGVEYSMENVAVQPGGKPVIGKFLNVVLNPGEEALYPNPGYPIYESMIEFLGGVAKPYSYVETEDGFDLDMEQLESQITDKTTVLVYNNYQNPMGAESSEKEMKHLADLAVKHDLWVLSDEAYFEIRYSGESQSIAKFPGMKERTVILYTFGKKFAMTGWRLGAAIGPEEVIAAIAKVNTNDESCTNHFNQYAAIEALTGDQSGSREILATLKERRDVAVELLNDIDGIYCHKPETTFYLFPNVTEAMKEKGFESLSDFQDAGLYNTGVSYCTRNHFGRPLPGERNKYLRFAYSGIDVEDIREGLGKFKEWIEG